MDPGPLDRHTVAAERPARRSVAVLASGGVESVCLLEHLSREYEKVFPIYFRFGLSWEGAEESCLRSFLASCGGPRLAALTVLDLPVSDLYHKHWSTTGQSVPDWQTPDEAVFLPGRNLLFIAKASVWCALNGVGILALGHLKSNPFPDATEQFFQQLAASCAEGLQHGIEIIRPFSTMTKEQVLSMSTGIPIELSFSCINPVLDGNTPLHCGRCNKCAERWRAFAAAGVDDRTRYASRVAADGAPISPSPT